MLLPILPAGSAHCPSVLQSNRGKLPLPRFAQPPCLLEVGFSQDSGAPAQTCFPAQEPNSSMFSSVFVLGLPGEGDYRRWWH